MAKGLCIIDVKFTGHEQGLFLKLTGQVQATGLSTVFALHNTCTETNAIKSVPGEWLQCSIYKKKS